MYNNDTSLCIPHAWGGRLGTFLGCITVYPRGACRHYKAARDYRGLSPCRQRLLHHHLMTCFLVTRPGSRHLLVFVSSNKSKTSAKRRGTPISPCAGCPLPRCVFQTSKSCGGGRSRYGLQVANFLRSLF